MDPSTAFTANAAAEQDKSEQRLASGMNDVKCEGTGEKSWKSQS
jgi:hypothetical protein